MNKYPRKTQNAISHYVKTLPSNVIPKFPPLFIELIKYHLNEQTEDTSSTNNNSNSTVINPNENSPTSNVKNSLLNKNSNGQLTNAQRESSNSSLSTYGHKNVLKNNNAIPLNRTKSLQGTYTNSINSIPSSYSETSSYYYNNHKRSLPGNLCLITKPAEFNDIQITLRELFLDLYSDDLLSQYFYPIFVDFSHENIFALWLKEDEENEGYHSSNNTAFWGLNSFQTNRSTTKQNSLINYPVNIGNLPIVKIGLEKQRIAVIAKNLNSFISLLTQNSFVSNIVRNYRIGGGDESTILSSEGSSDEEYNSIQDMMRCEGDFFESEITSDHSSNIILLDGLQNKSTHDLIDSSFLNTENEEDGNNTENEIETKNGKKEYNDNSSNKEETNEQFTLEIESNEGDDEREELEDDIDKSKIKIVIDDKSLEDSNDSNKSDEIIYVLSTDEANEEKKNKEKDEESEEKDEEKSDEKGDKEEDEEKKIESDLEENDHDQLYSDNETLSSSINKKHDTSRPNNDFVYDYGKKSSINNINYEHDNSLPNSYPYNRRFTDDYERMNKSELNIRRYSYASSINSTLTSVSASPFAIRTMFQQQETQMAYIQWYDEICKKDNINLDNSEEIEKKLLKEDSVLRKSSISSTRSNSRKYFSLDNFQYNKPYYDNKSLKGNSHMQAKYNQKSISLWDSILNKNRQNSMDKINNNSLDNQNDKSPTNSTTKENTEKVANSNESQSSASTVVKGDVDSARKKNLLKKSSNKLSVKSISQTLSKSATAAPKQIKRKLKETASLQKLKDTTLIPNKLKNKGSFGQRHSNQKQNSTYSKKLMNNEVLPPASSALSKNLSSSFSRTKISSPLSQNRNYPENYLNPRKNVPTTVTTMMTISNNLNHTHNSSLTAKTSPKIPSKTSPKIPSKLHNNMVVNRYRTNSSPAPSIYASNYGSRMYNAKKEYYIKPNLNNKSSANFISKYSTTSPQINKENININSNSSASTTTTTTTATITATNATTATTSVNTTSASASTTTASTATPTNTENPTIVVENADGPKLKVDTTLLSKKESKDSIKTAPPFLENTFLGNLFTPKKFPKFNGFNFLSSIPIVAKLLNLDVKETANSTDSKDNTNSTTTTTTDNQNNSKNNLPIDITQQNITRGTLAKSPEKSTPGTYTENGGGTINYISSSTLALQILEKERKGIPEPEQWLQKQVKARAYALAVAKFVAKRQNQKSNNDYSQYTTKFTPTHHIHNKRTPMVENSNALLKTTVTTTTTASTDRKSVV